MILSIYQIDFIDSAGTATRLLDIGDPIGAMIDFSVKQSADSFTSLGNPWGGSRASGGARRPLSWARQIEHVSHAAAASFAIRHPASLPLSREGKLRVTVSGGEVWDLLDAVILDATTRPDQDGTYATLTNYTAEAGQTLPWSGLAHYAGIPTSWLLTTHTGQTLAHSAI
ncbi:MAG: hypothetical protein WCP45_04755 [Verrucomicrobiota bacterium]